MGDGDREQRNRNTGYKRKKTRSNFKKGKKRRDGGRLRKEAKETDYRI